MRTADASTEARPMNWPTAFGLAGGPKEDTSWREGRMGRSSRGLGLAEPVAVSVSVSSACPATDTTRRQLIARSLNDARAACRDSPTTSTVLVQSACRPRITHSCRAQPAVCTTTTSKPRSEQPSAGPLDQSDTVCTVTGHLGLPRRRRFRRPRPSLSLHIPCCVAVVAVVVEERIFDKHLLQDLAGRALRAPRRVPEADHRRRSINTDEVSPDLGEHAGVRRPRRRVDLDVAVDAQAPEAYREAPPQEFVEGRPCPHVTSNCGLRWSTRASRWTRPRRFCFMPSSRWPRSRRRRRSRRRSPSRTSQAANTRGPFRRRLPLPNDPRRGAARMPIDDDVKLLREAGCWVRGCGLERRGNARFYPWTLGTTPTTPTPSPWPETNDCEDVQHHQYHDFELAIGVDPVRNPPKLLLVIPYVPDTPAHMLLYSLDDVKGFGARLVPRFTAREVRAGDADAGDGGPGAAGSGCAALGGDGIIGYADERRPNRVSIRTSRLRRSRTADAVECALCRARPTKEPPTTKTGTPYGGAYRPCLSR
uniref:Uncharacterized protein n=1 Tax=Mycena chlorophos TaxID=658473 RepID=A0ABQ0LV41_MYCCL|nr:predicted protein [Mycena chlorophos]